MKNNSHKDMEKKSVIVCICLCEERSNMMYRKDV